MKFQTLNKVSIFEPGRLANLYSDLKSGANVKSVSRLSLDDLAKVPEIYGSLEPNNLDIPALDNDAEFVTPNRNVVLGRDIKALTALIYEKPRTAYVDFGKNSHVHTSWASGAVPLALLGFKRFKGIDYNKWNELLQRTTSSGLEYDKAGRVKGWKIKDNEDIRIYWKLDMLLGKTLSSTLYDPSIDTIKFTDSIGLLQVSTIQGRGWTPTPTTIRFLREAGFGNHRGNFATAWGTARISIDTVPEGVDTTIVSLWNACDTPMRLLLSQRWAWYGQHRCSDMICDVQNWDNQPKNIDKPSTLLEGQIAKREVDGVGGLFGL